MSDIKFRFVDLTEKTFENFIQRNKISLKEIIKSLIQFYYIFRSNFYLNHGTRNITQLINRETKYCHPIVIPVFIKDKQKMTSIKCNLSLI